MRTSHQNTPETISTIGIDVGKNTFHLVGLDKRGVIVLQQKVSRRQLGRRLSNIPRCLIGMEACSGTHYLARQLTALGHDVRLIPAQYVKPFLKGHKNDYRDAEAITEAVQRPTMHFVSIKTPEQMDLLALHRVRSRLVGQRTGVINQIRGFLLERGITVRQGPMPLRKALPEILSASSDALSPRMINLIGELIQDWRRLDERIAAVSSEIEALAKQDASCQRLMSVPGIGPIISSAVVAAIGNGAGFKQGRDFAAWLGLIPRQESTGDRTILGKISKRGNKYVRTLFVQAALEGLGNGAADPAAQSSYAMHAHGAVFAEVKVDPDLGQMRVSRVVGAFAAGRIINPRMVRSQLCGAMIWGVSFALHEHAVMDSRSG